MNFSSVSLCLGGFRPFLAALNVDGWILAFSAFTVAATIWMGFRSAKKSKTASDFFVAGRSVSVGWNASAISGEYLSAASFMGVAGMVMSSGYDALWYPVCYACGYLFLLLFIAGPLRRFGAYTIPDFAEGRFDSPVFRKIAVVFVLFIGFFYTMPQMKGAGTTLAYIFPGLPYWAGVVLVGAVITLNVALGGMKGITLVQAFQYWAKMFAISVPIFVLMAVYGHYGKQIETNVPQRASPSPTNVTFSPVTWKVVSVNGDSNQWSLKFQQAKSALSRRLGKPPLLFGDLDAFTALRILAENNGISRLLIASSAPQLGQLTNKIYVNTASTAGNWESDVRARFQTNGVDLLIASSALVILPAGQLAEWESIYQRQGMSAFEPAVNIHRESLPAKAPADSTWLNPFGPLTTKAAKNAAAAIGRKATNVVGRAVLSAPGRGVISDANVPVVARRGGDTAPYLASPIALRPGLSPDQHMTVNLDAPTVAQALAVYAELTGRKLLPNTNSISERVDDLLGGKLSHLKIVARPRPPDSGVREHADGAFTAAEVKAAIEEQLRTNGLAVVAVDANGFLMKKISREGGEGSEGRDERKFSAPSSPSLTSSASRETPASAEKAWLAKHEKPLALLYTYSLIIAIVCGTAGLPHILVRFYTNPDGTAAKKTTMWVMILIGVFYVFPPVFGAFGRNLLPDLYNGVGAKGTDKIVLELPRILNAKYPPLGSILSGIACAGAFAAFMSTFSGLLVSMTGALAHDVYGRILRPKATQQQRMRMFKIGAVIIGGVSILLGMQVEQLQINFMVGQAFAIAAASYFPLLFMAVWWRKLTMRGAATGMLTGGTLALAGISLTSFSDLKWIDLADFWAWHPLLRILCEQPAIWTVPFALVLMIVVSKLTAREVPSDIRMKMLVLHAPEQLGLKQEYIQEHQHGH